jgi:hypothetical protein
MKTTKREVKKVFDPEHIQAALLRAEDVFDRALVPFILLGDVAKQMEEGYVGFEASEIEVGINQRDFSRNAMEIIQMLVPDLAIEGNHLYFEHDGVPIKIVIVQRKYAFLANPDLRYFYLGTFRLPNPFKNYWQVRALLR